MAVELRVGAKAKELRAVYKDSFATRGMLDGTVKQPVHGNHITYLSAYADDNFIGVLMAVRLTLCEIEVHYLLLKQAREFAAEISELFLVWVFSHPQVLRLTANVADTLPSVIQFTERFGMLTEGYKRDAGTKDGVLCGVYTQGLTRRDYMARVM